MAPIFPSATERKIGLPLSQARTRPSRSQNPRYLKSSNEELLFGSISQSSPHCNCEWIAWSFGDYGLSNEMNLAESIAIEHSIADVLLRCLAQNLDPSECAFHLERRAVDFFQNRHRVPARAISPVILEAISTFATAHGAFKPRALSSLLVLSAASVASWNLVTSSKIFQQHPELYEILARSIVKDNVCLQFLTAEISNAISAALIELSDFSTYEKQSRLRTLPLTPASLAVKGFFGKKRNGKDFDSFASELLSGVLRCLPLSALESIPDDDWAKALDLALEFDVAREAVMVRTFLGLSRDSPARGDLLRVIRKHPESPMALQVTQAKSVVPSPQHSLMSSEKIFCSLSEINTAEKAYQLMKRLCAEGDEKSVKNAAAQWLSDGQLHLVTGAYLAAPSELNVLVDNKIAVYSALKELPLVLWSPVDDILDANLADLLSTIPEFSRLLGRRNVDNGNSAEMSLKRLALIHPFLVARRVQCVSSVCRTILHGLTNSEDRYERPCLRVLEVLFEVIGTLPIECHCIRDVEDLCIEIFEFLLEENRIENGVPDMFSELATAAFKCLSPIQSDLRGSRVEDLITKVGNGAGTSVRIREAMESLVPMLRSK